MSNKYEIWKDGDLYLTTEDKKVANRLFDIMRSFMPKPRVLKLYEKVTTTRILRDNDKVYDHAS